MFTRVSIGIKTFLRDGKLFRTVDDIRRNLPGAQMIIADDGEMTEEKDSIYAELIREGHKVLIFSFDSGFGFKSNQIANALDREFLLVGSDDFDFSPPSVAVGIEKMVAVLDGNPTLSVVSGRVDKRPYEFYLEDYGLGTIEERRVRLRLARESESMLLIQEPIPCDLTVNYSLIRRKVFWTEGFITDVDGVYWEPKRTSIGWDNDVKIGGGEHGAFFIDLKRAGIKVGWVPGVNIDQQPGEDSERYRQFRRRALAPQRPCFERRGIRKYVCGNGIIDYEERY
jgi:hypothetical protein